MVESQMKGSRNGIEATEAQVPASVCRNPSPSLLLPLLLGLQPTFGRKAGLGGENATSR